MKIRIYNDDDNDKNPVIELSKILSNAVKTKSIKGVYITYSKSLTKNGPLYGDFVIDV